ncbi:hypothetical protein [Streptomyces sp. NPDC092370]|uniref:hypothetical protein n=1 Tax=Streptomyces sp. NPDC092370 TaxID=3366016 RepID=UPI003827CC3D
MRPSPFTADLQHLTPAQRQRFRRVVLDAFVPGLRPGRQFRPELRQSPGGPALITQTGSPGQNPAAAPPPEGGGASRGS